MKLCFYLSLLVARISRLVLNITKLTSGTAIIGLLTLKICPKFLKYADKYITKSKINITGTNGKTTTSAIVSHLLENNHNSIINNSSGANMLNGIVNSLALQINPFRKTEYSVIETDEAFLSKVYEEICGDYLLVTNLFEDQTDRFATPIVTKNLIQTAIDKCSNVQLILNADEPISASLKSSKNPIYFGVSEVIDSSGNILVSENSKYKCPLCEKELDYTKNFYSQVGHYKCCCGYVRPSVKYEAKITLLESSSIIVLGNERFEIPLKGLYNAYNALGAIALSKELKVKNIGENLKTLTPPAGRNETKYLNGHKVTIQLIKNPAGTNEILKGVNVDSNILIAMNNLEADGTDISWIGQVDFEKLANHTKEIVLTGLCAKDMARRLDEISIKDYKIIEDIKTAVSYVGNFSDKDITILTTYTALLKINKIKEIKKCF